MKQGLRVGLWMILFFLGTGGLPISGPASAQWDPGDTLDFQSGDMLTYSLYKQDSEGSTEGRMSIWATETESNELELLLSGDFAGVNFTTASTSPIGQGMELVSSVHHAAAQDLPYDPEQFVQFLFMAHWAFVPLDEDILQVGFADTVTTPYGNRFDVAVPERRTHGGVEGYVVTIGAPSESTMIELVYNPDLPLPIHASMGDDSMQVSATLKDYAQNRTPPDIALPPRVLWQQELHNVVDHLRSAGLDISEVRPHNTQMMGATAALSIQVAGHPTPIELYGYDPETTPSERIELVEAARETAEIFIAEMALDIPVAVNGYLLLSNVDYFGGGSHPAKDGILEAFMGY